MQRKAYKYLRIRKIKGFSTQIDNASLQSGVKAMLSLAGLGKMRPNILLLGYKNDWRNCNQQSLEEYLSTIQ